MFGRCHRRLQKTEQESRQTEAAAHAKVGAAMRRPSLASTRSGGVLKETKKRIGLGQLLRARIRPMAGDTPSGYSLTGQSGLVAPRVPALQVPGGRAFGYPKQ